MGSSLKGYIPALARLVELSPAALYERQRALVRAGLLASESGRGPGSGVRTTAGSVALILISILATDSLSEVSDRVRQIAESTPSGAKRCPLTHMVKFTDAFSAILAQKALSRRVTGIIVSRSHQAAWIKFKGGESEFSGTTGQKAPVRVEAALDREIFRSIADDVFAMLTDGTPD